MFRRNKGTQTIKNIYLQNEKGQLQEKLCPIERARRSEEEREICLTRKVILIAQGVSSKSVADERIS